MAELPPLPGCDGPLEEWDGVPVATLATRWGVPRLLVFRRVGSTSDAARALAQAGWPEGSCVVGEEQTAGRGRGGRRWASPPGAGLYLSLLLRPPAAIAPGALPLLVGAAVAAALAPLCAPARARVKWPNDVLLDGRKGCGILCEGAWEGSRLGFVIAGIGINVAQREEDFAPEVRDFATSLRLAAGEAPPRHQVGEVVTRSVLRALRAAGAGSDPLAEFRRWDALRGERVRVSTGAGREVVGEAEGVTDEGSLRVRTADAVLEVRSGTVRLAEAREHLPALAAPAPPLRGLG